VSATWLVIIVLCAGTIATKALGPLVLGGRVPPARAISVITLVAPAVLTSLVLYETFSDGHAGIAVDARVVGLGVGGAAAIARLPMIAVVVLAAAATAVTRLLI
jgi:branched chain amino acid efflux pump